MIVVIPMAGRSQRFRDAGYILPKHELPIGNGTMFDHAVGSFRHYFNSADFLFVTRDDRGTIFAQSHAKALGIKSFQTVEDDNPQGYASSVYQGLSKTAFDLNQPALIHVIDTFRPNFQLPVDLNTACFSEFCIATADPSSSSPKQKRGFLREPPLDQSVRLSGWGSLSLPWLRGTGLHFFQSATSFMRGYQTARAAISSTSHVPEILEWALALREIHKRHHPIELRLVHSSHVIFCGTASEYEALRRNELTLQKMSAAYGAKPSG